VLFVTHRLVIAARLATHVAIAVDGALLAAPRDAALADPRAAALFGPALARVFGAAAP
jgi:hypothetical protein